NGDDFFRFAAKKGQRIVIDCLGFRLNSTIRAILTLSTAEGKELLRSKPYFNRTDPLLDFVAPADGDYILRLHDMTFLGGLPYRPIFKYFAEIWNRFPPAIRPGEKAGVAFVGPNLPRGKPPSRLEYSRSIPGRSQGLDTAPKDPLLEKRF